jgi:hypothetical protein
MKSIERLKAEHEQIECRLTLLDKAVARIGAGQPLPAEGNSLVLLVFLQFLWLFFFRRITNDSTFNMGAGH